MEKEVVRIAKQNLEDGERWHKKVNVREMVFGFNDGSISTLALLAGVTGGASTEQGRKQLEPIQFKFKNTNAKLRSEVQEIKLPFQA